jgi:hypothetical protein
MECIRQTSSFWNKKCHEMEGYHIGKGWLRRLVCAARSQEYFDEGAFTDVAFVQCMGTVPTQSPFIESAQFCESKVNWGLLIITTTYEETIVALCISSASVLCRVIVGLCLNSDVGVAYWWGCSPFPLHTQGQVDRQVSRALHMDDA